VRIDDVGIGRLNQNYIHFELTRNDRLDYNKLVETVLLGEPTFWSYLSWRRPCFDKNIRKNDNCGSPINVCRI